MGTEEKSKLIVSKNRSKIYMAVGVGVCALLFGAAMPTVKWTVFGQNQVETFNTHQVSSAVGKLALLSPPERSPLLQQIAENGKGIDRSRARYLLAIDQIQAGLGEAALQYLDGLETEYQILAAHVLQQRAIAYELIGNPDQAQETWQRLLKNYPDSPVVAEGLYQLGQTDPQYWQQAIEQFPSHPRTVDIAVQLLNQRSSLTPETDRRLRLLIAEYGLHLPEIVNYLDRLTSRYEKELTPEEWELIGFGYWEKQEYGKGGEAYKKAVRTPENAYRAARGLWLGDKEKEAIAEYKKLIAEFPDSEDTALGLIRLARLVEPKEAIPYLDQVIAKFPDRAAEALLDRSKRLEQLGSKKSAQQARESILTQYSNSEQAAELRWQKAESLAGAGDLTGAWKWAQQLGQENPDSKLAPKASFWIGKWAQRLGKQQEAKTAFEYVLANYPESYYAWRSAVNLGWDVGDFTTVRSLSPIVVKPHERSPLPAGSTALQELYQLGLDKAAWTLWQVEFQNRMEPKVAEQFTDGVIRVGVGENLDGMFMLTSLSWRTDPQEVAEYQQLKQTTTYAEALYPFPYQDLILNWSTQQQLNPLLVTALIRQESRFMPKIKSWVGATGLMQVMPETAEWIASKTNIQDYDLENPEENIKLGTWYLDYTHEKYQNNSMLAVASYNAGPGNVAKWLQRFGWNDPDEFHSKIPFPETKDYVEKVFGNYWNYLRLYNPDISQRLNS
jgi:soluble lytic murein transglycosylase